MNHHCYIYICRYILDYINQIYIYIHQIIIVIMYRYIDIQNIILTLTSFKTGKKKQQCFWMIRLAGAEDDHRAVTHLHLTGHDVFVFLCRSMMLAIYWNGYL